MNLNYLKTLKKLEIEFASSQRKAFACADLDEKSFYVCLNIFDNSENIEYQDENFEITRSIMKKNKLGTALVNIASSFTKIKDIIYHYIDLCDELEFENSDLLIRTRIITPLFLDLGKENIYFNLLKDFELKMYEKELNLFKKRKSDIFNFNRETYKEMLLNIEDNGIKQIFNDIIDTDNILKEYMEEQNIKSFTIDYLKNYILEIEEKIKLVDIYFNTNNNSLYNDLSENERLFLFNVIENHSNNFLYPTSKVETKIKLDNNYINIWKFQNEYLQRKYSKDKEKNRKILLDYIKNNDIQIFSTYRINTIQELLNISFIEILKNKITIKKCKNCNKFFITESRTDEKYCNRISPQNPNKTCKEYGAKKTYREEIKSIPIKHEHNKTSQFYRMRINRCKNKNEKSKYEKEFNIYKKTYQNKKSQYNSGTLQELDFVNWIKNQKTNNKKSNLNNREAEN